MWTIDELVERVRQALAAQHSGAADGRVRDVPDRRAVRWYTTIGLVDRPLGMRGRTAVYGPRHLQQLVAIKRRQASGRSLAQIQEELCGIADTPLAELADIPEALLQAPELDHQPRTHEVRFWTQPPVAGPIPASTPAAKPIPASTPAAGSAVSGIVLGGGAILILPRPLSEGDHDDLITAAAPLLRLLEARGLIDGRPE